MSEFERVLELHNEVEASLLESVLKEKKIPHIIRSNHDTALNGIYQAQLGWGFVEAEAEYAQEIINIYNDIMGNRENYEIVEDESTQKNLDAEAAGDDEIKNVKKKNVWSIVLVIILLILIVFFVYIFIADRKPDRRSRFKTPNLGYVNSGLVFLEPPPPAAITIPSIYPGLRDR